MYHFIFLPALTGQQRQFTVNPAASSEFPAYARENHRPEIRKFEPLSEEATREQVEQSIDHWQQHGFGLWVFHRKSDGAFIGRAGLKTYPIDGKDVIGLAYAVMPDYWKRGFATEMAEASLDVGFGDLGFSEIASWTLPVNLASQRVMEKLGFRYERDFEFAGLLHRRYRLVAGDWRR